MRKKMIIAVVSVIILIFVGYKYMYKSHRDISAEDVMYSSTVSEVYAEFQKNDSLANSKYLDKTVQIKGKITAIDIQNKIITVDERLLGRYTKGKHANLKVGDSITLKGRVVGYDDLLDEIQMDQCSAKP